MVATLKLTAQSGFNNLEFIENKGQWDSRVRFMGDLKSGAFFLERDGFTVVLHNPEDIKKMIHRHHNYSSGNTSARHTPGKPDLSVRSHAYKMKFEGGSAQPEIIPDKK